MGYLRHGEAAGQVARLHVDQPSILESFAVQGPLFVREHGMTFDLWDVKSNETRHRRNREKNMQPYLHAGQNQMSVFQVLLIVGPRQGVQHADDQRRQQQLKLRLSVRLVQLESESLQVDDWTRWVGLDAIL